MSLRLDIYRLLQLFALCAVMISFPTLAQVYKCQVDGKIQYSQLPCETEESAGEIGLKRLESELDRASVHGTIATVEDIGSAWRCNSIAQAFEYVPSASSAGKLLFDFSVKSEEKLREFSKVGLGSIQLRAKFKIETATQHWPYCTASGLRSLRKPKASFSYAIGAIEGIPLKEKMPKTSEILSLLKRNGYRMEQREDHLYTFKWDFWDSTCRSNLVTRYSSAEELKGVKFSVSCSKKNKVNK